MWKYFKYLVKCVKCRPYMNGKRGSCVKTVDSLMATTLNNGRLTALNTPTRLLHYPQHEFATLLMQIILLRPVFYDQILSRRFLISIPCEGTSPSPRFRSYLIFWFDPVLSFTVWVSSYPGLYPCSRFFTSYCTKRSSG